MKRRFATKFIATYAMFAGTSGFIAACSPQQAAFASVDVTGAEYAKNFELTDHNGQVRHIQDFAGKVVVVGVILRRGSVEAPAAIEIVADAEI